MTEGGIASIGPDAGIAVTAARMVDREVDHLPVDGGKVVGIITTTDLAVHLSRAREGTE